MNTDIESRLRRTFATKAGSIDASELAPDLAGQVPTALLVDSAGPARHRGATLGAIAAAVVLVLGVVGGIVGRDRIERAHTTPPATGPEVTSSTARAWPLNGDEPLSTYSPQSDLASPESVARAYFATIANVGRDWPLGDIVVDGSTAKVRYVLQDVPSELHVAQDVSGLWYLTGALTDQARPGRPVPTQGGVDVAVAPGPRTYERGSPVRLSALAADGEVLATETARTPPPAEGAGGSAAVVPLRWSGRELAAAVVVDVLDDHDGDAATPEAVVGRWVAGLSAPSTGPHPIGYDEATAEPVFAAEGSAEEVADAYLRDRFPDHPAPGVETGRAQSRGDRAFVDWSTGGGDEGLIAGGVIALRRTGDGWVVVSVSTAGIDLSRLRIVSGRLQGRITSENTNALFADVLRPDGTLVPGATNPNGFEGASYRFGTAGGPGEGGLDLDIDVAGEEPVLRLHLVGGTVLSITELRFPPTA